MQIKLDHLDRLVLDLERDSSSPDRIEREVLEFKQGKPVSQEYVCHASVFITRLLGSDDAIFKGMPLPAKGHANYVKWATSSGHNFETSVTAASFERIVRRLVEVASGGVHAKGKIRISSHDLRSLFSNWMDSTL